MSENQTPETDDRILEDCSFHLAVVDGVTSLRVEGTLGGISEAFANAALQSPQLDEVLKMVTFMLFEHQMADGKDEPTEDETDVPAEATEMLRKLFGQMGEA
jgi:hypothetical protein